MRRLLTLDYSTGKLALGEQNWYGVAPDWITLDHNKADFNLDFREHTPLPFDDNSQHIAYSTHTLEHLPETTVDWLLREVQRVLRPGGHIRLELPDVEKALNAYRNNDRTLIDYQVAGLQSLVTGRGYPPIYAADHIAVLCMASCYLDENGHSAPVIVTKEDFEAKLESLDLDAFGQWALSLQTPEQQRTGGHVNLMYFDKIARTLDAAGFRNIRRMTNGQTQIPGLSLRGIERPHRAVISLYVEAEK